MFYTVYLAQYRDEKPRLDEGRAIRGWWSVEVMR